MLIATWNINSIRTRQSQVLAWLQQHQVDILYLQETKVIDGDFPRYSFEESGYHVYTFGQKAYNGVALFSRHPLENVAGGFGSILGESFGEWDEQKRVITATLGNLRLVNVYVPNGSEVGSEKYEYKLHWFQILQQYLQVLRNDFPQEICLGGDFNAAPDDRDIYNPKGRENHIMASAPERQALGDVLALGFQDGFRKFTPEGGHFSWWDYRRSGFTQNRGWRIDHLYLTPQLYSQALKCTIDLEPRKQEQPSDHAPVTVELYYDGR